MPDSVDVVFDIDGVLSDFSFGFKEFVRRFYNVPLSPCGAKKSWQFRGLAPAEEDEIWGRIARGQYDWSAQPSLLTSGDLFAMTTLRSVVSPLPVRYQYVTSRLGPEEQVIEQTTRWLRDNGLPDYGNVTVTDDKVSVLKRFVYVGGLIDDDIRNIAAYHGVFGTDIVFIRDWAYNRVGEVDAVYGASDELIAATDVRRVSSVSEFCFAVLEMIDGVDRG